jgi:hypothetical protein
LSSSHDGIARVDVAIGATDQGASIGRFDGGDGRTEMNRNGMMAALRRENFHEDAVATDDAPLRMISTNHLLVAKRQDTRPAPDRPRRSLRPLALDGTA